MNTTLRLMEDDDPGTVHGSRLNPPPGPHSDGEGNFLPLPKWVPGQPRPADWPRHIHAPREVYDWAKQHGIDRRTLLEPTTQNWRKEQRQL